LWVRFFVSDHDPFLIVNACSTIYEIVFMDKRAIAAHARQRSIVVERDNVTLAETLKAYAAALGGNYSGTYHARTANDSAGSR
jgi:hypothetical protein